MLNVKYVLADGYFPPETQGSAALRHDGEVKVYEILHTMPRASVIHGVRQVRDDGVALATMRTGGFDPHREILWSLGGAPPAVAAPSTPDSVRTLRYDFNDIEYFVSTTAPGVFLTIEQYDPDWKAFVDGKPVPIERVNYFMRGVPVTPGVHHVRYQYEPKALAEGIKISIASAVIAALIGLWGREAARRRAASAPRLGSARSACPRGRRRMKALIIVPTYNERENLEVLVRRIFDQKLPTEILVVDDNSPDGTGALADEMAARDPRVHVMHRAGKMGLGSAYVAGFKWALARDYDAVSRWTAISATTRTAWGISYGRSSTPTSYWAPATSTG
jgi:hypothetical protein